MNCVAQSENITCYFISYDLNSASYTNYRFEVNCLKDTERLESFRERILVLYGVDPNSYLITWVFDMKVT